MKTTKLAFELKFFKPSGKYYTDQYVTIDAQLVGGDDNAASLYMSDVVEKIRDQVGSGDSNIPSGFYILVDHPLGYPCLITDFVDK